MGGRLISHCSSLHTLYYIIIYCICNMLVGNILLLASNNYLNKYMYNRNIFQNSNCSNKIPTQQKKSGQSYWHWDYSIKLMPGEKTALRRNKLLSHKEQLAGKNAESMLPWSRSELPLQNWREEKRKEFNNSSFCNYQTLSMPVPDWTPRSGSLMLIRREGTSQAGGPTKAGEAPSSYSKFLGLLGKIMIG